MILNKQPINHAKGVLNHTIRIVEGVDTAEAVTGDFSALFHPMNYIIFMVNDGETDVTFTFTDDDNTDRSIVLKAGESIHDLRFLERIKKIVATPAGSGSFRCIAACYK